MATTTLKSRQGGSGVNNGTKTLTLAGSFATSGTSDLTLTTTGATNVTLPTTGTLLASGGALGTPTSGNLANCTGYPGIPTAASQSDQETGTSTTTFVSPGRQQYHPSALKFWAKGTGGGSTVNASYNVTSATRNGTGDYSVAYTVAMSSAHYYVDGNASNNTLFCPDPSNMATGSIRFGLFNSFAGGLTDPTYYCVGGAGDQS